MDQAEIDPNDWTLILTMHLLLHCDPFPCGDILNPRIYLPASNNVAEYEALVHGLSIAISLGVKRLMVYDDSLVVISQVNKD